MAARWVGKDRVRESLAELANEEVQRRLWTSPESPTDFIECICELFDDSALGEALDGGEGVFGHDADSILREIDTLAQRIDGMRTPDAVVNDPLMLQLRDLAARALAALDAAEQGDR